MNMAVVKAAKRKVAKKPAKKVVKPAKKVVAKSIRTVRATAPRARAKKTTEPTELQAEALIENLLGDNNEDNDGGAEPFCGDGGDTFSNGEPGLPSDEGFCNEGGESTEQEIVMDADQTVNTSGDSIDGDEADDITEQQEEAILSELLTDTETGDEDDEDEDIGDDGCDDEEDEDGEGDEA
jgi:hypothetical protein